MSSKKIIPRRDHEVYFIPRPEALASKRMRAVVCTALGELHPGFTAASAVDMQPLSFKTRRWIMATVMDSETLAEYRILHKGATLYTNTSLLAHEKTFVTNGVNTVDDERIGFDADAAQPVSVPLEKADGGNTQELAGTLTRAPRRYGVFGGKPPYLIAASAVGVTALLAASLWFIFSSQPHAQAVTAPPAAALPVTADAVPADVLTLMPPAISILAEVSAHIANTGGRMTSWRYSEGEDPCISIQCRGVPVQTVHAVFSEIAYITLQDMRDVSYVDGVPHFTVFADANRADYTWPEYMAFPGQSESLAITTALINLLQSQKVTVVSETLPGAGGALYTLTYTAEDRNLIRSLEILEQVCAQHVLRLTGMDITISGDRRLFTVACVLARGETAGDSANRSKRAIPVAFGYRPPPRAVEPPPEQAVPIAEPAVAGSAVVGSIEDAGGKILFFRDTDGKMKSRDAQ
jgi:hypothetical protein